MRSVLQTTSVVIMLAAGAARAEDNGKLGIFVESRVGGAFPGLFNRLRVAPTFALEGGALFALDQHLGAVFEISYAQPRSSRTVEDARLTTGGKYNATLTMRDLGLFAGGKWLFPSLAQRLTPYVEAGVRVHFIDTIVQGSAGADFGQNDETSPQWGAALRVGASYALGPGALSLTVEAAYAEVAQVVTGASNISNILTQLGYGLNF